MRVRHLTLACGPGVQRSPGEILDLPDAEARALVEAGFAEALGTDAPAPAPEGPKAAPVETATAAPPPETTEAPRPHRRGRRG